MQIWSSPALMASKWSYIKPKLLQWLKNSYMIWLHFLPIYQVISCLGTLHKHSIWPRRSPSCLCLLISNTVTNLSGFAWGSSGFWTEICVSRETSLFCEYQDSWFSHHPKAPMVFKFCLKDHYPNELFSSHSAISDNPNILDFVFCLKFLIF